MSKHDIPMIISVDATTTFQADEQVMQFLRKAMATYGPEERVIDWEFNTDWLNRETINGEDSNL
jgi:hypothetical protein